MQIALTVSAKSEMKQECGEGWLFLGSGGVSRDKRLSTSLISHPVQRLLQQVLPNAAPAGCVADCKVAFLFPLGDGDADYPFIEGGQMPLPGMEKFFPIQVVRGK